MSEKKTIRELKSDYSPDLNPLVLSGEIKTKKKRVRVGVKDTVSEETGELINTTGIMTIEEKDQEHFVKVFADGVSAAYELSKPAHRVFTAILREYELVPLSGGFVDSVNLPWFGAGLCGRDIGMSKRTFNRGFGELLEKGFLAPKHPETYWINPNLFFKGDRVRFIKEYRLKKTENAASHVDAVNKAVKNSLED